MRKQLTKKKFKIFGKTLLSVVLIASGVAVAIVFPSPITVAVLSGAAALLGGQNGIYDERCKECERRKRKEKEWEAGKQRERL